MRKVFSILLVFFSILSVLFMASCTSTTSSPVSSTPLTFEDKLQGRCYDLEGNPVTLSSDYYLVYYAADWCSYCAEYTEQLKTMYELLIRMYGNVEIIFAGHERDLSNDNLVSFMEQGGYRFPYVRYEYREETGIMDLVDVPKFWIPGFVLVDRYGKVLSSSNGMTLEDYSRDRPIQHYQAIQQCDCVVEADWSVSQSTQPSYPSI